MAMLTPTLDLVSYYAKLLIIQYVSKAKAKATIEAQVTPALMPQVSKQLVSFFIVPASGSFVLRWDGNNTASINWNDSQADVQTKIRAVPGLGAVTVSGSPATSGFTVTFHGVTAPAALMTLVSSSLDTGNPTIVETDETLPIAVQNAFNLTGDTVAVGVQLNILGKYTGVSRTGQGLTQPITLNDADYLTLIRLSIFTNNAGSDLATIQELISTFFPGKMRVFDYQNMHMSYYVSTTLGSRDLIEMFITQGLLPRPMGVQVASIIFTPTLTGFFGMVSYEIPMNPDISPFNTYEDYQTDYPVMDYSYALTA